MYRPHASLEELLAFAAEGEPLHPATRQHLNCCPTCQYQMSSYQKMANCLISQLYRSRCPSAAALSYYCLPNILTDLERLQIAEHIAHCPLCAHDLAETRQFLHVS